MHAAVKRVEKALRQQLAVEQGEGDEGADEEAQKASSKWGKSKRGYYGADTEEYEVKTASSP